MVVGVALVAEQSFWLLALLMFVLVVVGEPVLFGEMEVIAVLVSVPLALWLLVIVAAGSAEASAAAAAAAAAA